ncbi:hypothetical protein jhhlp_001117 [Lomentospora prolificans]|uniref:Mid2 domain-containing protein n=1 Tax=Lomentospora prolificans TaxID=41688 RepID=A0A2N3NHB6_9PEZI|nr:hypothetical protein jhhlp_001117 [Lomentospora prolificans]
MRKFSSTRQRGPSFLSGLLRLLVLLSAQPARAVPYPRDDLHDVGYSYLMPRACAQYCGADNQYCCEAGSACMTEGGIAMCAGGQGIYTTTWTETKTFTSTITSDLPAAVATPVDKSVPCEPQSEDWTPCGWVCCDWWQECAVDGQCVAKSGFEGGPGGAGQPTVITTNGQVTTLFSAPFRVTGTGSAAASGTAVAGEGQDDEGPSLSPGAIAGIVIGTLAGIGLLFLLCFCLIAKGILGAIFGGRKKKERSREEMYDDRYTRSSRPPSSYFTKRGTHSSWYGSSSSPRRSEKKKKSSGGMWLGITAAAATLLALLNIKKDKKPPSRRTPTMYTDSYTYSYSNSSPSKFSALLGYPRFSFAG